MTKKKKLEKGILNLDSNKANQYSNIPVKLVKVNTGIFSETGQGIMNFVTCLQIRLFLRNRSIVDFYGYEGRGGGYEIRPFL